VLVFEDGGFEGARAAVAVVLVLKAVGEDARLVPAIGVIGGGRVVAGGAGGFRGTQRRERILAAKTGCGHNPRLNGQSAHETPNQEDHSSVARGVNHRGLRADRNIAQHRENQTAQRGISRRLRSKRYDQFPCDASHFF